MTTQHDFSGTSSGEEAAVRAGTLKRYFSSSAANSGRPIRWTKEGFDSRQAPDLGPIESAIDDSCSLLDLRDDWDGEGAAGYKPETWRAAIEFLRRYATAAWLRSGGTSIPAPDIGPGPDGSIDIHWESEGSELLINVPADLSQVATFYGDDYGDTSIKGTFYLSSENRGLIQWLITMR